MAVILVIDDNHAMRRLTSRILTDAGHSVHQAEGGRQGLDCLRQVLRMATQLGANAALEKPFVAEALRWHGDDLLACPGIQGALEFRSA